MMRLGASSGYVRSKLTVLHGGPGRPPTAEFDGALAVSAEPEEEYADHLRLERIRAPRIKDYEGDSCEECGSFTLIRNGTCLKCDICGTTSGCS
jgi:ribonucleoside-diphosphate reductase alpha chain